MGAWPLLIMLYLMVFQPLGATGSRQLCVSNNEAFATFMLRANTFLPLSLLGLPIIITMLMFTFKRSWHHSLWMDRILPVIALILHGIVWALLVWQPQYEPTI